MNVRDGVAEVGGEVSLWIDLLRGLETQLAQVALAVISHVPRGVSDHLFWVMDPVGGYIPVSLRYCHDYPVNTCLP